MSTTYASAATPRPGSSPGEHRPTYRSWEMAVRLTTGPLGCLEEDRPPVVGEVVLVADAGVGPYEATIRSVEEDGSLCLLSTRLA